MRLERPPFWLLSLVTLGIMRAAWVSSTNKRLDRGGAGFWFAWFLLPFAHYGLATRINQELAVAGSRQNISPLWCFFFTGWPFFGATRQFKRGVAMVNDAHHVRTHARAFAGTETGLTSGA